MINTKGMSPWYCPCGNPRGFEASMFRAQGLVPLTISEAYRYMVRAARLPILTGHDDDKGDKWLWVPPALRILIPSGVSLKDRVSACTRLGELPTPERDELLIDLHVIGQLAGPEAIAQAVLG